MTIFETNSVVSFPRRPRGRPSAASVERHEAAKAEFCRTILKINSGLDFRVSSRGWCYILEEHGLSKGEFDDAQRLINECRKDGLLPIDICALDSGRSTVNLKYIDDTTAEEEAADILDRMKSAHLGYHPFSFWDDQEFYVEMAVEKIDLQTLFESVCAEFYVPLTNVSGWNDINTRAAMMERFAEWESNGNTPVLLYCGDHDPGGLHITEWLRSNFEDLSGAVGWTPGNLIIERFGLNADFIERHRLTWVENLETGGGGRLDDPDHADHEKEYVQSYLRRFGARKVEANALVVRPEAGRELCRRTILKYVPESTLVEYRAQLAREQEAVRLEVLRLLNGGES